MELHRTGPHIHCPSSCFHRFSPDALPFHSRSRTEAIVHNENQPKISSFSNFNFVPLRSDLSSSTSTNNFSNLPSSLSGITTFKQDGKSLLNFQPTSLELQWWGSPLTRVHNSPLLKLSCSCLRSFCHFWRTISWLSKNHGLRYSTHSFSSWLLKMNW